MKFKFGDKVKVSNGFYVGLEGTVDSVQEGIQSGWDEYYVNLIVPHVKMVLPKITRIIQENELELLEAREL